MLTEFSIPLSLYEGLHGYCIHSALAGCTNTYLSAVIATAIKVAAAVTF